MKSQYDLTVCPDCGRKQKKPKKKGDNCEAGELNCETHIIKWRGKLIWWNPN